MKSADAASELSGLGRAISRFFMRRVDTWTLISKREAPRNNKMQVRRGTKAQGNQDFAKADHAFALLQESESARHRGHRKFVRRRRGGGFADTDAPAYRS